MNKTPITFDHLAELTKRAWRFAQNEWPELPSGPIPVFELKKPGDMRKQGIGYPMTELKALNHAEVIARVIHEVGIFATLMRGEKPEQVEATFETLVARINAANVAEAGQSTKH